MKGKKTIQKTTEAIQKQQERVVVLGWNYSTALGMVRSVGMAGFVVDLYYISKNKTNIRTILGSKYIHRSFVHAEWDDLPIIEELLSAYDGHQGKIVLLPSDDYTSSLLDRYYDQLSRQFLMPHIGKGEQGAITRFMDKTIQAELGKTHGLNVMGYTKIYIPEDGQVTIPDHVEYPCFVKPIASLQGRKKDMRRCDTPEQLLKTLNRIYKKRGGGRTVIAQQYVEISEEYSISGLALGDMVFLPALLRRLYTGKSERGVTIVGKLVEISEVVDFKDKLVSLIQSLHFSGLFSFDLVRSSDTVYFSEINFRSAGSLYGYVRAGANLPAILLDFLLKGNKPTSPPVVKMGTTFFYDKVGWEDLMNGYCTKKEFSHYQVISDFSLMKDDLDPKPGIILYKALRKKFWLDRHFPKLKKMYKGIKHFINGKGS